MTWGRARRSLVGPAALWQPGLLQVLCAQVGREGNVTWDVRAAAWSGLLRFGSQAMALGVHALLCWDSHTMACSYLLRCQAPGLKAVCSGGLRAWLWYPQARWCGAGAPRLDWEGLTGGAVVPRCGVLCMCRRRCDLAR